ncbi:MAG: GIY-YIG nuclease family protein [Microgenomates group bacterium]
MNGFVYILQSLKNNSYYIGSTDNINKRIDEHNRGKSLYTKNILPVKLVFSQQYPSLKAARKAEYWLKSLKSKNILEKIIEDKKINRVFV